jgi:hypothetical protein
MKTVLRLGALAVLFVVSLAVFAPGGVREPSVANAYLCGAAETGELRVQIIDTATGNQLTVAGTQVRVTPNPVAGIGAMIINDNGTNDEASSEIGLVSRVTACSTENAEIYTAAIESPPQGCTADPATDSGQLAIADVLTLHINVTCAQAASSIELVADPPIVACGGTTTLTATVRDAGGNIVDGQAFTFSPTAVDPGTPATDGVATLTLQPGDKDVMVSVEAAGLTKELLVDNQCAPLSIVADPPYLPCGGGTTKLTAVLRDVDGNVVADAVYQWSTPDGALDAGIPNTASAVDGSAVLFLPSSINSATVTVLAGGESTSLTIRQVCDRLAIAVTADPNVIPCSGTANLTASVRDINGHLVEGLGFHWEVVDADGSKGSLYVGPPNTADETDGRATLTLTPGMTTTTVRAWVGEMTSNPGEVTVQQYCPDVVSDGSSATGAIQLSASSTTVGCGEAVFVGARLRDSKGQVPAFIVAPDGSTHGRDIRFLASAGVFQLELGVTTSYTNSEANQALTTVSQYNGETDKTGVLNVTYLAPLYGGDAVITAASGDQFAKLTIHVACAAPPPAAVASAGGTGGASCTPIGDGVCIPGNRSVSIRPPSTGDAGLK